MSEFLKNTAGQIVKGHLKASANGGDTITAGASVQVVVGNGAATPGAGALEYKAGDLWHYTPTQAETNGDALSYIFTAPGALSDTVDIYPTTKRLRDLQDIASGAEMALAAATINTIRNGMALDASLTSALVALGVSLDALAAALAAVEVDTGRIPETPAAAGEYSAALIALAALVAKIKAATRDSAALDGNTLTLSDGATMQITDAGRVTVEP